MQELPNPNDGFLTALFDLSFSSFVTTRLIKVLYIILIIVAAFGALTLLLAGLKSGFFIFFLTLIISPVVFIFYVIVARVWLEVIMVLFRIAEDVRRIAGSKEL